jgi:hypothetical protein
MVPFSLLALAAKRLVVEVEIEVEGVDVRVLKLKGEPF